MTMRSSQPRAHPPPPASYPSFFGPRTDNLQDYLGEHYAADPADHTRTVAMATGGTPLPLHSPPLRQSRGGLNVAARHILPPSTSTTAAFTSRTHNSYPPT